MGKGCSKPVVALIGRPNVGKSTLFNLLCGSRKAIVEDTPGLTRDRNYAEVRVNDRSFTVVDTGGFEPEADHVVLAQMRTQTLVAIEQADIIVYLGDAKVGLSPSDYEIVRMLQRADKKVFYLVNKIDSEKHENEAVDFHGLGVQELFPVSALTGYGISDFLDALTAELPPIAKTEPTPADQDAALVQVAVVGRPNVGKSTLINLLLGEERLVTDATPGTTRDAIDTMVRNHGKEYLFIDTAGVRRRSRIVDRVEKYCVLKAFQSIDRANIVIVMLDAQEGVTDQDARIVGYAHERGRGIILVLNKWDLVKKDSSTIIRYREHVRQSLKFVNYAPILTISALHGTRAPKIFPLIDDLFTRYRKRVGTGELNRFLAELVGQHPPGLYRQNKPVKIYYATQVKTAPPPLLPFSRIFLMRSTSLTRDFWRIA